MSARLWLLAACVAGALYLAGSSFYVVNEGEQALVVRLGAPQGVETSPGLKFKAPFVDAVYVYDTRLQLLEPPTEQVILGDQKRLEVQSFTRFRIVDPLRFYQALRSLDQARPQLAQMMSSSVRRTLGQVPLTALLTHERDRVIDTIRDEVAAKAEPLGLAIDEVRFHRADLPFETSQAIYDRMKSERQREAKELRAQGFEWAQQIQSKADHDRTILISEAQSAAAVLRGEGDADANRILSEAFEVDVRFYEFYRSLQTYGKALAQASPTLVLSPDAQFLKLLRDGPASAPAAEELGARP